MSVFTPLSAEQAATWLEDYALGTLVALEGIAEGVQNSNFFLTTTHGPYVLTVFEQVARAAVPFHVELMAHLAAHGIPCPQPVANLAGAYVKEIAGKPAVVVSRLPGRSESAPNLAQCAAIGTLLAELHLAAK